MWPVQTLTLLLCLTDEEQLFAQAIPQDMPPPAIEAPAPPPAPVQGSALLLLIADEA